MRKIVMMNRISLDGYYARNNRGIDWFIHDPAVDVAAHEMMNPDTLLMGRYTYQMFEAAWRPVLEDLDVNPHSLQLATELRDLNKVVFSQTLKEITWENSRIAKQDIVSEAKALKQRDGADIGMFGSGEIARVLIEAGLIDEYILIVTPVVLGTGKSFFRDAEQYPLTLLETRSFESGNVVLHYEQQ